MLYCKRNIGINNNTSLENLQYGYFGIKSLISFDL